MDNGNINGKAAIFQLFPGVEHASRSNYGVSTNIGELYDGSAKDNATSDITKAFQDFTSIFKDFHNLNYSNINSTDLNGRSKGNLFKTDEGKEVVQKLPCVSIDTILSQNLEYDGGLRYADEDDNIFKAAENYAKAEIGAIEKSHKIAAKNKKNNIDKNKVDGKLDYGEFQVAHRNTSPYYNQLVQRANLDKEGNSISFDEYASFLLAMDSFGKNEEGEYDFDISRADGLITQKEAAFAKGLDDDTLRSYARIIYDTYYKN